MARSTTGKKRIRQNLTRRLRNRGAKAALRTAIKKCRAVLAAGDPAAGAAALRGVQKKVDKTAAKGMIRKKTAARIKSRLTQKLNALQPAKEATT